MDLNKKKKLLELKRVETAKMELELKIEERLDEIERLKDAIKIQQETENKIKNELKLEE